jgi:hypothetical protein
MGNTRPEPVVNSEREIFALRCHFSVSSECNAIRCTRLWDRRDHPPIGPIHICPTSEVNFSLVTQLRRDAFYIAGMNQSSCR